MTQHLRDAQETTAPQTDSESTRDGGRFTIAIDVGGTTVKGLAVSDGGDVLSQQTTDTFGRDRSAIESIVELIDSLQEAAHSAGSSVAAISVCTPGTVDSRTGVVTFAANLGWAELPLQRLLAERFGLPVRIDHDARAAGTAEAAASGLPSQGLNLLFIPIGTGIASAILIDGQPLVGATGSTGEIGHISVYPDGDRCSCGQYGCVEAYSSASNILSRYRRSGGSATSVPAIVATLDHDPIAQQVWAQAIEALARGIAGAIATVDPAVIVIGGGLSQAGDALLAPLRQRIKDLLTWRPTPDIRVALLGAEAGLIGSAMAAAPSAAAERQRFALRLQSQLREERDNLSILSATP